ncbi:hypothetical protein Tco_0499297 [Tanacetum coccineum]
MFSKKQSKEVGKMRRKYNLLILLLITLDEHWILDSSKARFGVECEESKKMMKTMLKRQSLHNSLRQKKKAYTRAKTEYLFHQFLKHLVVPDNIMNVFCILIVAENEPIKDMIYEDLTIDQLEMEELDIEVANGLMLSLRN